MEHQLRVLTIGHSYVVAMNRAVARRIGEDPQFEVTVAAPEYFHGDLRPIHLEDEPSESRIRVVPLAARLTRFVHMFGYDSQSLTNLVASGDFDVVHSWEEPYIFAGYQIAKAVQVTSARLCFRTAQSYVKRYPPPFAFFEREVLNRAQGWIAGAGLVYQAMLERKYPERSGRILNLAVDLEAFTPSSAEDRRMVLAELGLSPPLIGFVGRLTLSKGVGRLIDVMDKLLDQRWSLLFLGSGECRAQIEKWVLNRGLKDRVRIVLALHNEVPRYMGAMDLLVAPSQTAKNWREQFGRMLIEAFACGVPVIGSDSGEIPYLIGNAGHIVSELDSSAWAEKIVELLNDDLARQRLIALGLERAKKFSVTSSAEDYKAYYRWLVDQPLKS